MKNKKESPLFNVIRNNLNILKSDEKFREILEKNDIINCKAQHPSLTNLLVKSRYEKSADIQPAISKCNSKKCGLCDLLLEGSFFEFNNGKKFKINDNMSCDVKNVIYVIRCNGCKLEYIGETANLRDRTRVHKQHIKQPEYSILNVSDHIRNCASNSFSIMPILKMKNDCVISRRIKEQQLIRNYNTTLNNELYS